MTINYLLMAVCGIYGGVGVYQMIRGGSRVRPLGVIAALIVFVLAAVATFKGLNYDQMRMLIENYFRG